MRFRNLSIRIKLIIIILFIAVVGLLANYSLEYFRIIKAFREDMIETLTLETKMIGDYIVTTLLFDDPEGAREILDNLRNIPYIKAGKLFDLDGSLFASYGEYPEEAVNDIRVQEPGTIVTGKYIYVSEEVSYKNIPYGRVSIAASTDHLSARIHEHLKDIPLMILILLFLIVFLTFWFQKIISQPILKLTEITKDIAKSDDYSMRIQTGSGDEIGVLYDNFNKLLEKLTIREGERDKALEELKLEQQNLEKRVEERTRELAAAKDRAEESDHLKSAFLANMSHEIRTPLNAIIGFSSIMTKKSLSKEKLQDYNSYIAASGTELLGLINDILDIAKIEANQIDINLEYVGLNDSLDYLKETLKQSLIAERKEGAVDLKLNIPTREKDYIVHTDELRLKQILTNLVHNAIKFTEEGYIEIGYQVSTEKSLTLYVKDTGIGMPQEKLDTIFERFVKLHNSKSKLFRGSGLGLSIAHKLTELLGAEIRVESELNEGTTFYISIPFHNMVESRAKVNNPPVAETALDIGEAKILIAEDNETNFMLLKETIDHFTEAQIVWAQDGQQAIDYCKSDPGICLVLMDILMPVMNGNEATRKIKSFRKELPIIAQTAHASQQEENLCLEAGCDDVIKKPIDVDELMSKIIHFTGLKNPAA